MIIYIGAGCKATEDMAKSPEEIETVADTQLAKKSKCIANEAKTYYLCIADDDPQMDPLRKAYVIVSRDGFIMRDVSRVHGTVEWLDNDTLIESIYARVMSDTEGEKNVKTRKVKVVKTEK